MEREEHISRGRIFSEHTDNATGQSGWKQSTLLFYESKEQDNTLIFNSWLHSKLANILSNTTN